MNRSKKELLNKVLLISFIVLLSGCQPGSRELQWQQEEGYRWAEVELGYFGSTGFHKLSSSETNVSFETYLTDQEIAENQMLLHGSGVAAADVDGDGLTDLYFAQLNGPNKLYRNTGNFQFEDITEQAGVAHEGVYSTGVLFADIDGDGNPDLLVNTMDGPLGVYLNDGTGSFTQVKNSGLGNGNGGSTLTMADINHDGDLDLFVANNKKRRVYDIYSQEELQSGNITERTGPDENEQPGYKLKGPFDQYFEIIYREGQSPRLGEIGEPNKLFLNEGNGQFREVTNEEGRFLNTAGESATLKPEWSLTARFQDINGDRHPDLYVCNDYFGPDRVWINQGNGTFREIDNLAIRNFSYSSMGVAVSDLNMDGRQDLFVTEMLSQTHKRRARQQVSTEIKTSKINEIGYQPQYMRNSMYLNRGDNTFAEIAYYSGLEASEWSWATRFMDIDLDGHEDIYINTGFAYNSIDMDYFEDRSRDKSAVDLDEAPELNLKNKIFRNNGDLTFTEMGETWGFYEEDVSYGLASADFDNDGDLDIATSRFKSEAAIYENNSNKPRIGVRLNGVAPNTDAIGAQITLEGGPAVQSKQLISGGDYLSSSDPFVMFAATPDFRSHKITVTWTDGTQSSIDSVAANRIYEIDQSQIPASVPEPDTRRNMSKEPIFEDISEQITHQHTEAPFNDFSIQPLLPLRLSRLGPGLSWIDYDSDGDDDLFITSGRSGKLAIRENMGDGKFAARSLGALTGATPTDQTTILGWLEGEELRLTLGRANYETENLKGSSASIYRLEEGNTADEQELPGDFSTTGPLAAADYDGDGDLDLFLGGRFVPAHYPMDANSRLFKNKGGQFVLDEANSSMLNRVGLVTGAVFSDFDTDGDPDLILSREWDSILLLQNNDGVFTDVSGQFGLSQYKGWWSGITTGDFNNDGRPDIVATNWGGNTPYQLDAGFPLTMFYQDFNRDGRADIIESYYDPQSGAYVPRRQMQAYQSISSAMLSGVSSNREFAESSLQELLQTSLQQIPSKEINTMKTMLFINHGDRFELNPLPKEAQYSSAFYVGVADYNNDGSEDLFLTQNFFEVPPEVPRMDNGRGLWLEGNGDGSFEAIPAQISGIKVYGQQRGAALSDFNSDGKVDLAVSQNDSTTKLYRNQTNSRGISVQLSGEPANGSAIGSSLQLMYKDGSTGPLREINAGSGYWSQNSTVQVLGVAGNKEPVSLRIKWYDGQSQQIELQQETWEYQVTKE